ncbi:MAG: DNA/RNA nuclease SfsA [Candidatus Woesearchaeota archaeon]|jgi:sugar fermentation stimulation protein A
MNKYLFSKPLIPELIKSRPNRFIMQVDIKGKTEKCHCPCTGRIGNIVFKEIPCLLSKSTDPHRKTKYTVEAISLNSKGWIGIDQTKANTYIEFFLKNNLLKNMISVTNIQREVKLHNSKIDFLINNTCFLEVKTPLTHLPFGTRKPNTTFNSFERLARHVEEISQNINPGQRALLVLCYMYNATPFKIPEKPNAEIINTIKKATSRGLEHWQINLKIDETGVSLLNYFTLDLFDN